MQRRVLIVGRPVMLQESGLQLWTGLDVGSIAVFEVETGWVAQLLSNSRELTLFAACVGDKRDRHNDHADVRKRHRQRLPACCQVCYATLQNARRSFVSSST